MKKIYILFTILFLTVHSISFAQSKNGTIKGNIQSEEKTPLIGINVSLEGTTLGSSTDANGNFTIQHVPPGNYTLLTSGIGYTAEKQNIQVDEGKTIHLNLKLNESTQSLSEVVVSAQRESYLEKNSSTSLRSDAPLIETPQSIQVISNQVMKDQQAQNLNDVTKNMTGVVNNNMYTSYTMRGFSNYYPSSFITFDGFIGNMYQWSQMVQLYNIDRVEMIAGPAAALFSVGTPGGVINMVTKKPLEVRNYSVRLSYGSWNNVDISTDLTGPLTRNHKLLYRLNVGYNYGKSFRPFQHNQNLMLAPSLTYQFNDRTEVNLDFVFNQNKSRFAYDRGGLVFMNPDSTYNWDGALSKFVHNSPADYGLINSHSLTLRFNHQFSDKLKLTYMARLIRIYFDMGEHYGSLYGDHYLTSLDSIPRNYDRWTYRPYNIQNSAFITYKTGSEKISQTLIAGADVQFLGNTQNRYIDDVATKISITNPDYSNDDFDRYSLPANYQDDKEHGRLIGVYVQDIISIKNKIKILLAGRYDNYTVKRPPVSEANWTQTTDESEADVFLPRVGLVYHFNPKHSVYGSYCESFNPQWSNNREAGGPFPPQKGKQYEVGLKAQYFNGKLMPMLAFYTIDLINVLKTDPTDPTGKRQVAVPGVTSRGAEFTLQGSIKDFSIIAGYAYNHVVFAENSPLGEKGDRYDNAPQHIANIWIKYVVPATSKLKGLGFGAGGKYIGDRVGSAANQHFLMPAYSLLDASISYRIKNLTIDLNGFNLLNKKYILGGYYSDIQVPVGTPVNWKVGIRYTIN